MPVPELPIGSIIAFGGPRDTRGWEAQTGWLHCDGRLLDKNDFDYRDLFAAIGFAWGGDGNTKFNLPGLQGFFLRGVDASRQPAMPDAQVPFPVDPDRDERIPSRPGGNGGQEAGSVQLSATAMPRKKFFTSTQGDHFHHMNFELYASRDVGRQVNTVAHPGDPRRAGPVTSNSGMHDHGILGGDKETRPVNAYVYWIIRFR